MSALDELVEATLARGVDTSAGQVLADWLAERSFRIDPTRTRVGVVMIEPGSSAWALRWHAEWRRGDRAMPWLDLALGGGPWPVPPALQLLDVLLASADWPPAGRRQMCLALARKAWAAASRRVADGGEQPSERVERLLSEAEAGIETLRDHVESVESYRLLSTRLRRDTREGQHHGGAIECVLGAALGSAERAFAGARQAGWTDDDLLRWALDALRPLLP